MPSKTNGSTVDAYQKRLSRRARNRKETPFYDSLAAELTARDTQEQLDAGLGDVQEPASVSPMDEVLANG